MASELDKRKRETLTQIRARTAAMYDEAQNRILAELGKTVPDGKAFLPFGWHSRWTCPPTPRLS